MTSDTPRSRLSHLKQALDNAEQVLEENGWDLRMQRPTFLRLIVEPLRAALAASPDERPAQLSSDEVEDILDLARDKAAADTLIEWIKSEREAPCEHD